ncbi:hypothetical protein OAB57_02370, partial [Bacteriovoracaceae bacterium]|nr:hypothetical protein [Bacteriovoracaceae bacterium]
EEMSRKETTAGEWEVINKWYANVEIPSLLSKLLNENLCSWQDNAYWNDNKNMVNFELESFLANDLFDAKGSNCFSAHSETQTLLKISCDITIYPEKLPGVPRIIAKRVRPLVETLIEKMIGPNLTSLGKGLNDYFANL